MWDCAVLDAGANVITGNILKENIYELEKVLGRHQDVCLRLARMRQAKGERRSLVQERATMLEKQKQSILRHIQRIYHINSLTSQNSICGLELTCDLAALDEEQLSSVLGYACHATLMISKYLQVALRYELVHSASRSLVRDCLSSNGTGYTYPLFRRETEQRCFNKAVTLLAADIAQLMSARGLEYNNNFCMLRNLKLILSRA